MKGLLTILFLIMISTAVAGVEFTIHQNTQLESPSVDQINTAIDHFAAIVKRSCGIEMEYSVTTAQNIVNLPTEYKMEILPAEKEVDGEINLYKYYQSELAQIVAGNKLSRKSNEVKLLVVPNFDGYCGFAFPEVQFEFGEEYPNNPLTAKLKNYILIHTDQTGCGGFKRLLSHELGHIFIQDNPAHMCNENGKSNKCSESNLMSVFRTINPGPVHTKHPGNFGGGFGGGDFGGPGIPDPVSPIKRPSLGTGLLESQCQAIQMTLSEL